MPEHARPMGSMTLEELRRVVTDLSNSAYVRYWVAHNYDPVPRRPPPDGEPYCMALSAIGEDGTQAELYEPEMERRGFRKEVQEDVFVFWVVARVDDEGRPWRSPFRS